jgi:hypothetical protein
VPNQEIKLKLSIQQRYYGSAKTDISERRGQKRRDKFGKANNDGQITLRNQILTRLFFLFYKFN